MHNTACCNAIDPDGSGECGCLDEFVAKDRMTLGFRHLGVVLAVGAGESGPSRFSAGLTILDVERPEFVLPRVGEGLLQAADKSAENGLLAADADNSADPVIRELLGALADVKGMDRRHADIDADTMRLAIFARLLRLRSEAQHPPSRAGGYGSAERRMGARKWRFKPTVEYFDKHLADKITLTACSVPSKSEQFPSYTNMIAPPARDGTRLDGTRGADRNEIAAVHRRIPSQQADLARASHAHGHRFAGGRYRIQSRLRKRLRAIESDAPRRRQFALRYSPCGNPAGNRPVTARPAKNRVPGSRAAQSRFVYPWRRAMNSVNRPTLYAAKVELSVSLVLWQIRIDASADNGVCQFMN